MWFLIFFINHNEQISTLLVWFRYKMLKWNLQYDELYSKQNIHTHTHSCYCISILSQKKEIKDSFYIIISKFKFIDLDQRWSTGFILCCCLMRELKYFFNYSFWRMKLNNRKIRWTTRQAHKLIKAFYLVLLIENTCLHSLCKYIQKVDRGTLWLIMLFSLKWGFIYEYKQIHFRLFKN